MASIAAGLGPQPRLSCLRSRPAVRSRQLAPVASHASQSKGATQLLDTAIPVVDLSIPAEDAAKTLRAACQDVGFFYLSGHDVPEQLMEDVFTQMRAVFALPQHVKQAMLADQNNRGYTPFREQTLDPANQSTGDTKEGFYFGREVAADDPEAQKPLLGPNQWPDESLVPGFRSTMEAYYAACTAMGHKLTQVMSISLGLPADHFTSAFSPPMVWLRPLHYEATPSVPEQGIMGAGAHSDYGCWTFLLTDDVPGLQVLTKDGDWLNVPPKPGRFIVNVADMLERWTNGLYRSSKHRVVNLTGKERYSIPCFFDPHYEALIEPLPQCCTPDRPAAYPPTTTGQYILNKVAAIHALQTATSKGR